MMIRFIIISLSLTFNSGVEMTNQFIPEPITPEEYIMTLDQGTAGVLYIPNIGVQVKLNYGRYDYEVQNLQYYVDLENSAAVYNYGEFEEYYPEYYDSSILIMDHSNQGFSTLHNANYGDIAYIAKGNEIKKYEYDYTSIGWVEYDGIAGYITDGYQSLYRGYLDGITLQTCKDNIYRYMVRFREI